MTRKGGRILLGEAIHLMSSLRNTQLSSGAWRESNALPTMMGSQAYATMTDDMGLLGWGRVKWPRAPCRAVGER